MIQAKVDYSLLMWYGIREDRDKLPDSNCKASQTSFPRKHSSKCDDVSKPVKKKQLKSSQDRRLDPKKELFREDKQLFSESTEGSEKISSVMDDVSTMEETRDLDTDSTSVIVSDLSFRYSSASTPIGVSSSLSVLPLSPPLDSYGEDTQGKVCDVKWDSHPIALQFRGDGEMSSAKEPNSLAAVIQTTLESDQESDADLSKRINRVNVALASSDPEDGIASAEEDDDFKVHYVHHGKKGPEGVMNSGADLMQQMNELQEAVVAMKSSLEEAVTNLSSVVEDSSSGKEVEDMKRRCEGNSAEILKMVLSLRTDFSAFRSEISSIYNRQEFVQNAISMMLEDLGKAGVISQETRNRLNSPNGHSDLGHSEGHSASGSHSNDSGVALLQEKIQIPFVEDSRQFQPSSEHRTSDDDSLPEQPSLLVPASVYDYVAGLHHPNVSLTSDRCPGLVSGSSLPGRAEAEGRILDSDYACAVYDSDSSLTIAANKTISLSSCLSQEMRANSIPMYVSQGSQTPSDSERKRGSQETHKESHSRGRRRRPLLGVSSTKIHQQLPFHSHIHSANDQNQRHHHPSKNDPSEVQRYRLAKELLDTEKKYCRTLWTIQETFAEPLKKEAILSNKEFTTLFPEEVYLLHEKHCLLQHQLKERLASWKWQPLIGDILSRFIDPRHCEVLKLYTNYVNDFPEVLNTFQKLCRSSQPFASFIKGCLEHSSCDGQDLGVFLLSPVQRVPKYILLLKRLLKYTDSGHSDYRLIGDCLERLRDFLTHLNKAMERSFRLVHSPIWPATKMSEIDPNTFGSTESRNRKARVYHKSSPSAEIYRSPQRSCSSAGPLLAMKQNPHTASRSASLPRGFMSSSESPDSSSGDGAQEYFPDRCHSSSQVLQIALENPYAAHEPIYQQRPKYHSLTTARSVNNITSEGEKKAHWESLASSEPSLLEPKAEKKKAALHSSHSALNVAQSQKLVTWTDSLETEENAKKKASIKSSLKNIFTFKKRSAASLTRNGRDEPLYWSSSVILEDSDVSPKLQNSTPLSVPPVGDFVDEEGNPCSNV